MPELAILEQKVLTGIIEKYVAPPENVARAMFRKQSYPFTNLEWDVLKGSRERSTPTLPNREAIIVKQLGVGKKTASFIYVREKKAFEPTTLRWLREPGNLAKSSAEAAIRRETKDLNDRLERLVESYCWSALAGVITVTYEEGNSVAVDMGYQSSHKPTVSTAWSDAGADIIGNIYAWKKLVQQDTGFDATDIYLPGDTMEYVYKNTAIKGLFSEKHKWQYLQTSTIEGLLGLNWHVFNGGYENSVGTFIPYISADYVIMMSTGGNPFQLYEGLSADEDAPRNHTGKFSKSWLTTDPSARFFLIEYNFMPIVQRPDNIIYAKVLNP